MSPVILLDHPYLYCLCLPLSLGAEVDFHLPAKLSLKNDHIFNVH